LKKLKITTRVLKHLWLPIIIVHLTMLCVGCSDKSVAVELLLK